VSIEPRANSIHLVLWQRLLDAAYAMRSLAPWRWMTPHQRFAVRHPDTGDVGYACVLGHDGDAPGFAIHLGTAGLAGLGRLLRAPASPDDPLAALELYVAQHCLAVTYDDGPDDEPLDPEWPPATSPDPGPLRPHFRAHHPGCEPWALAPAEAAFLAIALEQGVAVARRLRRSPDELEPPVAGLVPVRVSDLTLSGLVWRDAWLWPPASAPSAAPPLEIDARRLAALRALPAEPPGPAGGEAASWEADFQLAPIAVQDGPGVRPHYPYRLVVADPADGTVIAEDEVDYDARHAALRELVLRAVEARAARPARLLVRRPGALAALAPLAACLEVTLSHAAELRAAPALARRGVPVASGAA